MAKDLASKKVSELGNDNEPELSMVRLTDLRAWAIAIVKKLDTLDDGHTLEWGVLSRDPFDQNDFHAVKKFLIDKFEIKESELK